MVVFGFADGILTNDFFRFDVSSSRVDGICCRFDCVTSPSVMSLSLECVTLRGDTLSMLMCEIKFAFEIAPLNVTQPTQTLDDVSSFQFFPFHDLASQTPNHCRIQFATFLGRQQLMIEPLPPVLCDCSLLNSKIYVPFRLVCQPCSVDLENRQNFLWSIESLH